MNAQQVSQVLHQLVGMPVSYPWRGYGSAVFLELGSLSFGRIGKHERQKGEACIAIEWDWRIENDNTVLGGSSSSAPDVVSLLATLRDVSIESILIDGSPPELVIQFSSRSRLRSMAMVSGDPQWTIRLPDDRWLLCRDGKVTVQDKPVSQELSVEERDVIDRGDAAAKRWGKPIADPMTGACRDCQSFVWLDGEFALLDYGVCAAQDSPFDGHATNLSSGCPAFISILE